MPLLARGRVRAAASPRRRGRHRRTAHRRRGSRHPTTRPDRGTRPSAWPSASAAAVLVVIGAQGDTDSAARRRRRARARPRRPRRRRRLRAGALARFYGQHLAWHVVRRRVLSAATLLVPVDYAHPAAGHHEGRGHSRALRPGHTAGSLIVNPGGPGASGMDFVRDASTSPSTASTTISTSLVRPRGVGAVAADPVHVVDRARRVLPHRPRAAYAGNAVRR